MRAGRLGKRVTLERYTEAADSYGQKVRTWSVFATVWAGVEPLNGREYYQAQQLNAETTIRIVIRHRSDVDTTCRIGFEGRELEVLNVIDPNMAHEELNLMCKELL